MEALGHSALKVLETAEVFGPNRPSGLDLNANDASVRGFQNTVDLIPVTGAIVTKPWPG